MEEVTRKYVSVNDNCIGCGRCMLECPAPETNISVYKGGQRRLSVNPDNCISCGGCVGICSHNARDYMDDTESFFEALKNGESVSLIVSTTFYMIFGERAANILGYLRSLGVHMIYDAGFGADVFVYLNARFAKEYSGDPQKRPFIINACPTVLNYIERYSPESVEYIVPVQSPPICTAIYVKKYMGDSSKLAYLSSCIARRSEFDLPSSGGNIDYCVTIDRLMKHIGSTDISGFSTHTDLTAPGFGDVISADGGLREYMSSLFSDEEVIVGYSELNERTRALIATVTNPNVPHPFMSIISACEYGCASSGGAGIAVQNNYETYLSYLRRMRRDSMIKKHRHPSYWDLYRSISENFVDIDPEDFRAHFTDRFYQLHNVPGNVINDVFNKLHMVREDQRHVDCRACGYKSCREMAEAVAKGYARVEDCIRYVNEEFRKKLFFDDLTGILSSAGFHAEMPLLLRANHDKKYVVCTGNINGIKTINDLYNFNTGSQVIVYVARMLSTIVNGMGICARLGGNNFVMCFENTEENLRRLMAIKYFDCGEMGIGMPVTVRFGLCEISGMGDVPRITNYASFAMEKNTDRLRNSFKWYDDDMRNEISVESAITSQMRQAMYNNEFFMYLQPQYSHTTKSLVGAETLCRWIKQDGTMISPGVFIPIFEKNGFIKKLDRFMWEMAFKQLKQWKDDGIDAVPISVNISRVSLADDEIIGVIGNLHSRYDIDQSLLHFEITESAYTNDQGALIKRISAIRDMGFLIAMDDFGSGYSSLNTLKDIPIDILKLDMGFLSGDSNREKGGSIIASVIRMAHSLGLVTIAEGVETLEQADFLNSVGCDVIQGFLYARPMPEKEYTELLKGSRKKDIRQVGGIVSDSISELFRRNSSGLRVFESYTGPAAIFDLTDDRIDILRVNDMMTDILGYTGHTSVEFSQTFRERIKNEDRQTINDAVARAVSGENGAVCIFGFTRPDDKQIVVRARLWHLGDNDGSSVIYVVADDVTDVISYGMSK